jgi:hypothetical protein
MKGWTTFVGGALAVVLAFAPTAGAQHGGGGGHAGGGAAVSHGAASHGAVVHAAPGPVHAAGGYYGYRGGYRGGYYYGRPYYGHPYYGHPYYGHPYYGHPYYGYYGHPYYTFHAYASVGFGVWIGYPVTYPYYDGYPYPYYGYGYPYPYPYAPYPGGYPPSSAPDPSQYSVAPTSTPSGSDPSAGNQQNQNMGGLSFNLTPSTAEIYVDGRYAGTGGDFTATTQPLDLLAGRHHIEIRSQGYRTTSFDADVVAGQVVPYRVDLQQQ